tara:strand:+ start:385 stop:798 length:414 start_codon:yes stop_codon:yes gene_type:complete
MSDSLQNKINEINNTKYIKTENLDSIVNETELNKLFDDNEFVVVDMTATWCGPCQLAKPKIIKLSKKEEFSHIKFVTCDLDESEDDFYLLEKTSVVPTFILLNKDKDGDVNVMSIFEGLHIDGLENEIKVYMCENES